jgi:ubiquinone/menaquinone biosynthesis C-methylase UbiE
VTDRPDSKQAEKTYLSRTGGSAWEREKPFPPAGTELFDESLELLNDFVVAMRLLRPSAADRIVDLGAGGGWCSDLLQKLNRRSVAVDISLEMLRVSRARPTRQPIRAVAGDFERLPFTDGAFDKAVCLSAIHHVPDMGAAVREIHRVLAPDGVAVFSEPGVGHAGKPWSVSASRDFGVLEQDVLIEPFIEQCRAAGFRHAAVCPIAYVIPEFELSLEEWRSWTRLPRTKRPYRALDKMMRAALEFAGAGKDSILFEEAYAMRLVRLLQVPVAEHPFFIAAKSDRRRTYPATYRATIAVESLPAAIQPGQRAEIVATLTNVGTALWRSRPDAATGTGHVRLGLQLLDASARVIDKDFARLDLNGDVGPGGSCRVSAAFAAPAAAGEYGLKIDLVAEGVTWFEPAGTVAVSRPLTVNR